MMKSLLNCFKKSEANQSTNVETPTTSKKMPKKLVIGLVSAVSALSMSVVSFADGVVPLTATTYINTTGVDFMAILNEMVALTPVLLPVMIGCTAFRKGLTFMFSMIRGA